jgi:hypothetical protein
MVFAARPRDSRCMRFDRRALLAALQNLYAADQGTQAFLHARFGLGEDPLQPYKKAIDRWLWPGVFRGQETSVSRAKRAITDYKKAIGDPEGLAELTVCRWRCRFLDHIPIDNEMSAAVQGFFCSANCQLSPTGLSAN